MRRPVGGPVGDGGNRVCRPGPPASDDQWRTIMMYRVLPLFMLALALVVFATAPVLAQDKPGTHEGTVVRAGDGKLTMTDKEGKREHTHDVPVTAQIICDGKPCKLDDLKKGFNVRVTTEKKGDKNVVTRIEAKKTE